MPSVIIGLLGRFVLIPASESTHGHGTHTWGVFWHKPLKDLLDSTAELLSAVGAGIQLAQNCTRILGRLGLLPRREYLVAGISPKGSTPSGR